MKPASSSSNLDTSASSHHLDTSASSAATPIRVLCKNDRPLKRTLSQNDSTESQLKLEHGKDHAARTLLDSELLQLKPEKDAKRFKLIDERDWNIVSTEPPSESVYFNEGHSALSIVSVIGPMGVGKSRLLNTLAGRKVFDIHESGATGRHLTRGIDMYSTYHRIFLDCQPFLATSVLEDFLTKRSSSQFAKNTLISDAFTSCHMIFIQLATFLITTSDYVIVMFQWLFDVHFLKLLASAIMLIGDDNLRAEFIFFSKDEGLHDQRLASTIRKCLGPKAKLRFISDEMELYIAIAPYSSEKLELYQKDPSKFAGKNWLVSCQKLWNSTIKGSSMFSDYARQVFDSNDHSIYSQPT